MENKYTPEQIKDIQAREIKAIAYLKELELTPACQMYKINIGNDTFADKVRPYLQDIKYNDKELIKENKKSLESK